MASSFRWIHSVVWPSGYTGLLVNKIQVGRYSVIHRDSGIYIQILVGQPENSGISEFRYISRRYNQL
jgi:hypothetical protein